MCTLLFAVVLLAGAQGSQLPPKPVGWQDTFVNTGRWRPLDMENKPHVKIEEPGCLKLWLEHVPAGWPYTFQWSGLKEDVQIDVARFPVLMAHVTHVVGYAHMDIDVLDAQGKAVKTLRSSTVNGPGISTIDLSTVLDPAVYRFQLRLIVGGENSGCSATYHWARFVRKDDADYFRANPDAAGYTHGSLRREGSGDEMPFRGGRPNPPFPSPFER